MTATTDAFRALHADGFFLIPNPWDVGSAKLFEEAGAKALATTSSGYARSIGKSDGEVTLDELVPHVAAITAAVGIPLNVDAERCYAADPSGIAAVVDRLAEAGAAGFSIEDWDRQAGAIDPLPAAIERVQAAVEAAAPHGLLVTARYEGLIRGVPEIEPVIERLQAYEAAGAECLFAPGLRTAETITAVLAEVGTPMNVILFGGPPPSELAVLGVRRASTGGALSGVAYEAAKSAMTGLLQA